MRVKLIQIALSIQIEYNTITIQVKHIVACRQTWYYQITGTND